MSRTGLLYTVFGLPLHFPFVEFFHLVSIFFFRLIFNQTSMIAKASITFVTKMQTAPILLDFIIALAKKDLLGMDTRAQVK